MITQKEKKQKRDTVKLVRDINHHKEANPVKDDKYNKAYERFKRPAYYQSDGGKHDGDGKDLS